MANDESVDRQFSLDSAIGDQNTSIHPSTDQERPHVKEQTGPRPLLIDRLKVLNTTLKTMHGQLDKMQLAPPVASPGEDRTQQHSRREAISTLSSSSKNSVARPPNYRIPPQPELPSVSLSDQDRVATEERMRLILIKQVRSPEDWFRPIPPNAGKHERYLRVLLAFEYLASWVVTFQAGAEFSKALQTVLVSNFRLDLEKEAGG
ncbi:hypothetical protein LTR86_005614 [Recurvomyces mirabilis]|nr:hypothetical protein LTR86_005614 [Recurvomyces mirabilis]